MFLVKNFKIFIFLILFQNIFCIFEIKNKKIIGFSVIGLTILFSYLILKKTKEEKLLNIIENEFNYYIKNNYFNIESINKNCKFLYCLESITYEELQKEMIKEYKFKEIITNNKKFIDEYKKIEKNYNYCLFLKKLLEISCNNSTLKNKLYLFYLIELYINKLNYKICIKNLDNLNEFKKHIDIFNKKNLNNSKEQAFLEIKKKNLLNSFEILFQMNKEKEIKEKEIKIIISPEIKKLNDYILELNLQLDELYTNKENLNISLNNNKNIEKIKNKINNLNEVEEKLKNEILQKKIERDNLRNKE